MSKLLIFIEEGFGKEIKGIINIEKSKKNENKNKKRYIKMIEGTNKNVQK